MKALLEKLPPSNYQLLKYLCSFLVKVSMNEGMLWTLITCANKHSAKVKEKVMCASVTQHFSLFLSILFVHSDEDSS